MMQVLRRTVTPALTVAATACCAACATVDNDVDVVSDTADASRADVGIDTAVDASPDTTDDTSGAADATPELDATSSELALVGTWDTNWGGFVRVTAEGVSFSWLGDDIVAITRFDNAGHWMVGQNTSADTWFPGMWSRFDWVDTGDGILWCQTAFAAASEQDALDTPAADATDTETGCGGFEWTVLTPGQGPFALDGTWTDEFGGIHAIEGEAWKQTFAEPEAAPLQFHIRQFDNERRYAIAQNDMSNEWAPELWSRFDWTVSGGDAWYCQTAWGAQTADDALATAAADDADPATTGCGGGPWSRLTLVIGE